METNEIQTFDADEALVRLLSFPTESVANHDMVEDVVDNPEKHKRVTKNYGSTDKFRYLESLLQICGGLNLNWQDSWRERDIALRKLGFVDYQDYLKSSWWLTTRNEYYKSCLLQNCMICGNKDFLLHHVTYKDLGCEKIENFLPLCQDHHKKLHLLLTEHALPIELSFEALVLCANKHCDFHNFNRRLEAYSKKKLTYLLGKLGFQCEVIPYCLGDHKLNHVFRSDKKDKRKIRLTDSLGCFQELYFDVRQGAIQLRYNGDYIRFDSFCLESFCGSIIEYVRPRKQCLQLNG